MQGEDAPPVGKAQFEHDPLRSAQCEPVEDWQHQQRREGHVRRHGGNVDAPAATAGLELRQHARVGAHEPQLGEQG